MCIFEKIINEYPLTLDVMVSNDIYRIEKKKYLILIKENIEKDNLYDVLNSVRRSVDELSSEWRTIIVVAYTTDFFRCTELFYFDGSNTIVVFYLINQQSNKIFMNDRWIFPLGLSHRKIVKKLNAIVEKYLE